MPGILYQPFVVHRSTIDAVVDVTTASTTAPYLVLGPMAAGGTSSPH